jgi:Second Messenger Oligonucleotide or Dinucleotide Synthetase domain
MDVMEVEITQKRAIVGLLEWACQKIELTETQATLAAERYDTIGRWLGDGEHHLLADATIYAQGSMRLRTTVRPVRRLEHDIDLICALPHTGPELPVADVHRLVGDRLRKHATYRSMLEPINRGWRLSYANEFHLDITPAVPDLAVGNGAVLVPDRALKTWKESHPKGYAAWFDAIAAMEALHVPRTRRLLKADVEPLPEDVPFRGALRRVVQVMKRHRDNVYLDKPASELCNAPISIIITTLAAQAFQRVARQAVYADEFDLLQAVARTMPAFITVGTDGKLWVPNPVNRYENFAEKWSVHPERAKAFVEWHARFQADADALAAARGLDEVKRLLARMLGEDTAVTVMKEYTDRISANRGAGGLTIAKSTTRAIGVAAATAASPAIRANTFFGSE